MTYSTVSKQELFTLVLFHWKSKIISFSWYTLDFWILFFGHLGQVQIKMDDRSAVGPLSTLNTYKFWRTPGRKIIIKEEPFKILSLVSSVPTFKTMSFMNPRVDKMYTCELIIYSTGTRVIHYFYYQQLIKTILNLFITFVMKATQKNHSLKKDTHCLTC